MSASKTVNIFLHTFAQKRGKILIDNLQTATKQGKSCLVVLPTEADISEILQGTQDLPISSEAANPKEKYREMYAACREGKHYLITAKMFNRATLMGSELAVFKGIAQLGYDLVLTDQVTSLFDLCVQSEAVRGYEQYSVRERIKGVRVVPACNNKCSGSMSYANVLAHHGRLLIHWDTALGVLNYPVFNYFDRTVIFSCDFQNTPMRLVLDLYDIPYTVNSSLLSQHTEIDWRKISITKIRDYYCYDPWMGKNFSQWDTKAKERRKHMQVFRRLMSQFLHKVARASYEQFCWTCPQYYRTALETNFNKHRYITYPYDTNNEEVVAVAYMKDTGNRIKDLQLFKDAGVEVSSIDMTVRDFKMFVTSTGLRVGKRVYAYIPNKNVRDAIVRFINTEKTQQRRSSVKATSREYYLTHTKPKREAAKQAVTST